MTEPAAEAAPLYVLGVKAERFMYIDVLDVVVSPTGLTQFTGANGNGKTDALTAIEATLCGGKAIPVMPVQAGAERAETEIQIGSPDGKPQFFARRVYRDGGGTSLEVRAADGSKQSSPQTLLASLLDAKFFNPVKFASPGMRTAGADNAYRLEILLELCPLRIDLAAHDSETKLHFDERTVVAKRVRDLEAVVKDAVAAPAPDGPEEDEVSLVGEIARYESGVALREAAAKRATEIHKEIDDIQEQIHKLQERVRLLADEAMKQADAAGGGEHPADLPSLKAMLAAVRERNGKRRAAVVDRTRAEERAKQLLAERTREAELSAKLAEMNRIREDAIKAAAFPLPKLTISSDGWLSVKKDDGTVIPFHQESTARRTLAGFVIFAASKPRLRACVVPSGNDLDHESMMRLAAMSKKFGIPVFVERIVGDPAAGAVIEFREGRAVSTTSTEVAS